MDDIEYVTDMKRMEIYHVLNNNKFKVIYRRRGGATNESFWFSIIHTRNQQPCIFSTKKLQGNTQEKRRYRNLELVVCHNTQKKPTTVKYNSKAKNGIGDWYLFGH